MGCGASKALEASPPSRYPSASWNLGPDPYTVYAESGSPHWAPNEDPSSPKAAVAEMEEEMRTMNAEREAGMEAEMRRMGLPAENSSNSRDAGSAGV